MKNVAQRAMNIVKNIVAGLSTMYVACNGHQYERLQSLVQDLSVTEHVYISVCIIEIVTHNSRNATIIAQTSMVYVQIYSYSFIAFCLQSNAN